MTEPFTPDQRVELAVIRYSGELSTKARGTRRRFQGRLLANLRDAFERAGIGARLRMTRDRIYVDAARPGAAELASRVFGVQSVAEAVPRPAPTLEAVAREGERLFRETVAGRRFAVRARRVGERARIPYLAQDVERALGAALRPYAAGVDLRHPEVTVRVELAAGEAFFVRATHPGPGGLPLGVEGRAVALVSGGFDSAVAAWRMMRRGVELDFVFCNLGGATHRLGVLRVLGQLVELWAHGSDPRLFELDFEGVVEALRERCTPRYWQVILKRLMLRAAEAVARDQRARAIVTGESVGQVSSQTLTNLAAISAATSLPILRPLVGCNKDEIIAEAERIGTAALSATVAEYCAVVPRHPATHARARAIAEQEARLDPQRIAKALGERRVFELRRLEPEAEAIPEIDLDAIPDGAEVIDLRPRSAFEAWHYPGALHLEFGQALATYPSFPRDRRYVFYCEFGLKSAFLAERMRSDGFEAYHFRGGLRALLRYARKRGAGGGALLDPLGLAGSAGKDEDG